MWMVLWFSLVGCGGASGDTDAACFGTLTCAFEYGCRDTFDNDGDGLVNRDDPDCDDFE